MVRDSRMINVTGLWSRKSERAGDYLAGNLNSRVRIVILSNRHKQSPDSPDYYLYLAPATFQTGTPEKPVPNRIDETIDLDVASILDDSGIISFDEDIPF